MTEPFEFEALPDGSANVRRGERLVGNVQNAAELGLYCKHESETVIQAGDYVLFCPDCGKTRNIGEDYT